MFLCAAHAESLYFEKLKIVTVDSDVAILCYLLSEAYGYINDIIEYETKTSIFDISSNEIDEISKEILPSIDALTGCDTTSCFSGQGKVKSLKILKEDERFIDAAKLLGECIHLSTTTKEVLEEFVCRLYGMKTETNINNARYKLFTASKKIPDPQKCLLKLTNVSSIFSLANTGTCPILCMMYPKE